MYDMNLPTPPSGEHLTQLWGIKHSLEILCDLTILSVSASLLPFVPEADRHSEASKILTAMGKISEDLD